MTTPHAIAGTLLHAGTRALATRHGVFTLHVCWDLTRRTYLLMIACGDLLGPAPLLSRVHSSCVTSESYGGCDCDCAEQLDAALAAIAAAGRGVVFYLDQEGRGAGFAAKVRDRMLVQASGGRLSTFEAYAGMGLAADLRRYESVAAARALLGVGAPLALLTNNPEKLATLSALGVPLAGAVPLAALAASPFNHHYLAAKTAAGHRLATTTVVDAAPPEPVDAVEPRAIPSAPDLVRLGNYWLPLRTRDGGAEDDPRWFGVHAYVDLASGRERVVLTYGDRPGATPLLRVQREALLERIPARARGIEQRRWSETVRAFVAHGSGIAVMVADEACAALLREEAPSPSAAASTSREDALAPTDDGSVSSEGGAAPTNDAIAPTSAATTAIEDATVALLVHHLAGRPALPLLDGSRAAAVESERCGRLAAAGVPLGGTRALSAE